MKKCGFLPFLFLFTSLSLYATTYYASPSDYTDYLGLLMPGDSLLLEAGAYYDRLNLDDIVGTEDQPIVISGPLTGNAAVFYGNACCNTVSIERCAYLKIQNLLIDGQDIPYIDAVKAEGTVDNWAHHITIENLLIINHGGAALTVGISTKCPAWGWVIRHNTLIEPGVGMYLGNSDGTAPFVDGVVEYNLVLNPQRYCLQIKHQNEGTRDVPGMPIEAHTTIRYNVFSKDENSDMDTPRPNLLVGSFPATGAGSSDYYEIYGNLLFQNPNEGLFQGTGNFAFYDNLLLNYYENGWGVLSFPHNGFAPRDVHCFNNTIYTTSYGIEIYNPNLAYTQRVMGNALFSNIPLQVDAGILTGGNVLGDPDFVDDFLINPFGALGQVDFRPLPGQLEIDPPLDPSLFVQYGRYDRDFEGRSRGWDIAGAYLPSEELLWNPDLEIRPEVNLLPVGVDVLYERGLFVLRLSPNPIRDLYLSLSANVSTEGTLDLALYDLRGRLLWRFSQQIGEGDWAGQFDLPDISRGLYVLKWTHTGADGRLFWGSLKVER